MGSIRDRQGSVSRVQIEARNGPAGKAGADNGGEVICNVCIKFVGKSEWLELTNNCDAVLIGAFMPSLSLITMESDCRDCGRPVYISPNENGIAKIVCLFCGLKLFSAGDQAALSSGMRSASKWANWS